jgi:hypothetical protein
MTTDILREKFGYPPNPPRYAAAKPRRSLGNGNRPPGIHRQDLPRGPRTPQPSPSSHANPTHRAQNRRNPSHVVQPDNGGNRFKEQWQVNRYHTEKYPSTMSRHYDVPSSPAYPVPGEFIPRNNPSFNTHHDASYNLPAARVLSPVHQVPQHFQLASEPSLRPVPVANYYAEFRRS